jgi:aminoglycoside 6'-N-acetyltransferase I
MARAEVDLQALGDLTVGQQERCAAILLEAFVHMQSAWVDLSAAREEVESFLVGGDRLAWAAVAPSGDVLGWIGCILQHPHAAELHPLAVDPGRQRGGVGTRLVRGLEARLRRRGVGVVWLGTDDDFGGTSLFGVDLFPNPVAHLPDLADTTKGHPFTFYQRLGYVVVGILPDVNGPGRHDILMAKRLSNGDSTLLGRRPA